jgi:hypothetical protein
VAVDAQFSNNNSSNSNSGWPSSNCLNPAPSTSVANDCVLKALIADQDAGGLVTSAATRTIYTDPSYPWRISSQPTTVQSSGSTWGGSTSSLPATSKETTDPWTFSNDTSFTPPDTSARHGSSTSGTLTTHSEDAIINPERLAMLAAYQENEHVVGDMVGAEEGGRAAKTKRFKGANNDPLPFNRLEKIWGSK